MRLRTKKSHFHNLPEGAPPGRTKILPRILRFCYFLVLLAIVAIICTVVYNRYIYFTGRGMIEISRIKVSSAHGGIIKALYKRAGDAFEEGDLLAKIKRDQKCVEKLPEQPQLKPKKSAPDIRLIRLRFDILQKQGQLNHYQRQIYDIESEMEKDEGAAILYRALEIGDIISRKKHDEMVRNVLRINDKIRLLETEIKLDQEELTMLELALTVPEPEPAPIVEPQIPLCEYEDIVASYSGRVDLVTHKDSEYLKKAAPLFVIIPEDTPVVVEAYFNKKNLPYLTKGEKLTIQFPDKTKSEGTIKEFVSSARYHADRILEDYLPVQSEILVTLTPTSESDKQLWQRFDRMDVQVKGERQ